MTRRLFGTDGVRGRANSHPMTPDMALRLGAAAGRYFRHDGSRAHRVVIGKDTRLSGYMIENALTAGFTSTGMNVLLLGPVPTPAVGILTPSMRADVGVMISASHNQATDNGIKFFGPDGFKLSDEAEKKIETLVFSDFDLARAENIGRAKRIDDGLFRYIERVKGTFPPGVRLDGLRVVLDCANGAAYRAAPEVLWELGADVIPLGVSPDGTNINAGVGSTAPHAAAAKIRETRADVAICLDGDADRIVIIDETGAVADGDQLLALFAQRWAVDGRLKGQSVVSTVMSNLGLERYLTEHAITLIRTAVGDRYVVESMRSNGLNLGGEQSGHIVMTDYATTGDGLIAGLHFLAEMVHTGKPASVLAQSFEKIPQLLQNVRYNDGNAPLDTPKVQAAIKAGQEKLNGQGRLIIRKSGTEPLIRIMAESEDQALMTRVVDDIVSAVERVS